MTFGKRHIPKHLIIHDNHAAPQKSSLGIGWICLALAIIATSMLVSLKSKADAYAIEETEKTSEHKSGQLFFSNKANKRIPSLHISSNAEVKIHGMLANITFQQTFRNDTSEFQEGIYVFPLSETAAINGMSIELGDRRIVGKIKERKKARKIYEKAVSEGKKAALTEQQRDNLFTQKIANIAPNETVTVTLEFIERVQYAHEQFSWRLPTTLTPRYIPGSPSNGHEHATMLSSNQDAHQDVTDSDNDIRANTHTKQFDINQTFGWALPTKQVPDAQLISPPFFSMVTAHGGGLTDSNKNRNTIDIKIELNSGLSLADINSPYHDIRIKKRNNKHHISLANGPTPMNRDFVLQWSATHQSTPRIAAYTEEVEGKFYTMLMVLPPSKPDAISTTNIDRSLATSRIFIIDTSGSMQGESIKQAKESLKVAINNLGDNTNFNIIEFNSHHTLLFRAAQKADQHTKNKAHKWIDSLKAGGGTEIYPALESAIKTLDNEKEKLQHIVFITDGSIGNEQQLFTLIHNKLQNIRLFTIGIGSAPNSFFMRKSAQFGRGSFTHIGSTDEVAEKMSKILQQINSVATKNIRVNLNNTASEIYPKKIGDLYYGEPLVISSETSEALNHVTVSGTTANNNWTQQIDIPSPQETAQNSGISSIWAREKIAALEDEKFTKKRALENINKDIIKVGLKHKLVSSQTSFVAVEQRISRHSSENLQKNSLPNLSPKGSTFDASKRQAVYPSTATTAEITWWLGLFSTMILIVFRRMNDDDNEL